MKKMGCDPAVYAYNELMKLIPCSEPIEENCCAPGGGGGFGNA